MWSLRFWVDLAERAVRTAAQAAVALLTGDVTGLVEVDWVQVASVSGLAAVVSVLMSVAGQGFGDPGSGAVVSVKPRHGG